MTKRKLYERFDGREYWIVDPELDTIKIYRRVGGAFAEFSLLLADVFSSPILTCVWDDGPAKAGHYVPTPRTDIT